MCKLYIREKLGIYRNIPSLIIERKLFLLCLRGLPIHYTVFSLLINDHLQPIHFLYSNTKGKMSSSLSKSL